MDFSCALKEAETQLKLPLSFEWKVEQLRCLRAIYNNRDLVAVLPTGYGKSLIFQAAPFLIAAKLGAETTKTIIVITPLNSIMMDQCRQLRDRGIKACYLDFNSQAAQAYDMLREGCDGEGELESSFPLKDIEACCFNIVFAHPESLLCSEGRQLMRSMRGSVCAIAVDEAHIVLEWGNDFRKDFKRTGDEVVPLFSSAPILLFTATAPPAKREELVKIMNLREPEQVIMNPDRQNIKYVSIERPASQDTKDHLDDILTKMGTDLRDQQNHYPITVVYTDTSIIAYSYWFMETFLGKNQYIQEPCPENRLFAQYHKEYTEKMKQFIVSEICKEESRVRLVFATVALGMGLNAPAIRQVIHYKPPTSLERYFQETGRANQQWQPFIGITLMYDPIGQELHVQLSIIARSQTSADGK